MFGKEQAKGERITQSAFSKADLHVHTVYSDGNATVPALLEHVATKTDLRVIAITDHDTIGGALEAQRLAPSFGVEVIVGEEVSTAEGHLLALFIERPLPPRRPAAQTIAAIHAQGGLAVAAHPYDWLVPSMGLHSLLQHRDPPQAKWELDGIETFNAGALLPDMNARAKVAARALSLPAIGGSDSHHLATVGSGYTIFAGQSAEEVRSAILQRKVQAEGQFWGWGATLEATRSVIVRALRQRLVQMRAGLSSAMPESSRPYTYDRS
jgi:predicted metal-dependent phosphoesterase TrpH